MAVPLLDIRELCVSFQTGPARAPVFQRAVDQVSLQVPARASFGVVGESGSGKSVTALSILRLIPEPPGRIDSGQILYSGPAPGAESGAERAPVDLRTLPAEALRRLRGNRIAMVFQEPMTALNPVFSVGDQIGEALRAHRQLSRKQGLQEAAELLNQVGIPDARRRARDYPHQLSGGQRQRVMIAMALCCRPDLLIADEPTTALDVTTQAQILDLLARLQAELGMALLLISHDLGVVSEVCETVAVMYAGQVVEQAPARTLFQQPRHPYTAGLLAALPRLHGGRGRLREIPGRVPRLGEMPTGCRFADRCERAAPQCRREAPALQKVRETATSAPELVRCHFPLPDLAGSPGVV
jgi:oligopeptide/dipeptide ABC transporter ATP-binding protein